MKGATVTTLTHILAVFLLTRCSDDPAGTDRIALAGILENGHAPNRVDIPGTYSVGEPVTVTIDTYGLGECIALGETVIERVSPLEVEITPIDLYEILEPDEFCTTRPKALRHIALVTFDGSGEARIVVRGRRLPAGSWYTDVGEVVSVERTLPLATN